MQGFLCAIAAASALSVMAEGAAAQAQTPIELTPIPVADGGFVGKGGKAATDISGLACMPSAGGPHLCLVVDDQGKNAQFARVEAGRMSPGAVLRLIGGEPDPGTSGTQPARGCPKEGSFADLDAEGVAYAKPYFYVVGSHGCTRKHGKFDRSSFLLARVHVDRDGRPVDRHDKPMPPDAPGEAVDFTWRVSDLLTHDERTRAFFTRSLKHGGLNIEGIAVVGNTAWFGLRAPLDKSTAAAFLVGGDIDDLFREGSGPARTYRAAIPLDLEGRGIRDLAALPDGRLLVLAGASDDSDVPFRLFVADPSGKTVKPLCTLPAIEGTVDGEKVSGKAEAVTVLEQTSSGASILVMFDGPSNGAPRRADIALPK